MTRVVWKLVLVSIAALGTASCAKKFSNDDIAGYVGTWAYDVSSITLVCNDGSQQNSSGSGQIVLAISSSDPTALQVAPSANCSATVNLSEQSDGYDLVGAQACPSDAGPSASLTQFHVAVDAHQPNTLIFSRTTSSTEATGTCTTAESGTATKA